MTDTFAALGIGLQTLFSWWGILIPLFGTLMAMVVSFLPGIGAASLAAVMVVATLDWSPEHVMLLFGALTGGATFMGSITSILFGIPGNAASSVTLIDGYPMAQAGRPRTAIAAAATASAAGSVIGVLVLLTLLPVVRPLLLQFGPLERAGLALWGLSTIIAVLNGSPLKAFAMAGLGLLLSCVGSDPTNSQPRWTYGQFGLADGLGPEAMLLGIFTLSEVMSWRGRSRLQPVSRQSNPDDSTRAGVMAVLKHRGLVLRSSLIGTVVGLIPGVGGTVAGFVAYGQTVQTARGDREEFGKGDIRGVIGPESAVDAKDGGSLLPVLALGLPGSEGGVFLLTAMTIHGLVPGTAMLGPALPLTFTLILALLLSNLLTSVAGLALVPALSRLTHLPIERLALPVLLAGLVSVVQMNGLFADLFVGVAFALLGYVLRRLNWPYVPFVIAFVLGPTLEGNLALTTQLQMLGRINIFTRPAAWVILGLTLMSLLWMLKRTRGGRRVAPTPSRRSDAVVATVFSLGVAVLAATALMGASAYSSYAIAVCLVTLLACAGLAADLWRRAQPSDEPFLPIPHRRPLALVFAFPFVAQLLGLPLAAGFLVLAWLLPGKKARLHDIARVTAAATLTILSVTFYLDHIASLDLPAPMLHGLLDWPEIALASLTSGGGP
jgi:putative tricarboxylic transport membrane protein